MRATNVVLADAQPIFRAGVREVLEETGRYRVVAQAGTGLEAVEHGQSATVDLIILGTNRGERVMRPDFGAGLHAFVFEPISAATITRIRNRVSEALVTWVQVMARPYHKARLIRIPGLDPQTQYVVEGMEGTLSGRSLEEAGIMMPVFKGDFRSALIHITKA